MSKRFSVALSFPGEHRDFVLAVAEALETQLTRKRVFYDEWYEVELLGAGGDLKLQGMYKDADLVVPFFSQYYDKPWCSMEWETIRGILLERRKDDAVIPVHLDDTQVEGWSVVNFGIRLRGRTPKQIADLIVQRLAMMNSTVTPQASPPTSSAASAPNPKASSPASGALAIWQEKLDYLQQHEAVTADPAQKFALKKQIEEAERRIEDYSSSGSQHGRSIRSDAPELQAPPKEIVVSFILREPSKESADDTIKVLTKIGFRKCTGGTATISARLPVTKFSKLFGTEAKFVGSSSPKQGTLGTQAGFYCEDELPIPEELSELVSSACVTPPMDRLSK